MALLEWLKNILSHQDGHLRYLISQKEVTLIRTAVSFFCKNNGEILVSLTLIWFISVFDTFWLVKTFYKEKNTLAQHQYSKEKLSQWMKMKHFWPDLGNTLFLHYIKDFENMYLESLYTVVSFTFSLKG